MALCNAHATISQKHGDILNRYSCLEQGASEGIPETMAVPVVDFRVLEYLG